MKTSVFPDTSGDLVLALKQHDDGSVTLDAVNANGSTKDFGKLFKFFSGGGHVDLSRQFIGQSPAFPLIADANGYPVIGT